MSKPKKQKGELLNAFKRRDLGKVLKLVHHLPESDRFSIPSIMDNSCLKKMSPLCSAIHHGNYHLCELLIKDGASLDEEYPLIVALRYEKSDIAELLIRSGSDVNMIYPSGGTLPMCWAIIRENPPRIVEQILAAGFPVNKIVSLEFQMTAIHTAAHENNIEAAKILINHSADLNIINGCGESPINTAVKRNFPDMVKLLFENGAILENKNNWVCPLFFAIKLQHLTMVEVLIDLGVNIQEGWSNDEIVPPLQIAIQYLHVDVIMLLIQKGANVTAKRRVSKETALHEVTTCLGFPSKNLKRKQVEVAKALIEKGADVNAKDCRGRTPLDGAINLEHTELCKLLLLENADVTGTGLIRGVGMLSNRFEYMVCMTAFKSPELMKLCLERGGDYEFRDRHGLTPYHCALAKYNPPMVKVFWQHFCPYDQPELQPGKMKKMLGYNPSEEDKKILKIQAQFMHGIENKKLDLVESALERGAEVRGCSMNTPSTLHYLASRDHKIAEVLLARGVPVDHINKKGETPLYVAVVKKKLQNVQVFLKSGACYNYHSAKLKATPLKTRVKEHKEIYELFKKINKSFRLVRQGDMKVLTFFQQFIVTRDLDTFSIVMNCINSKGQSLTELALCLGHTEIAFELLKLRLENI